MEYLSRDIGAISSRFHNDHTLGVDTSARSEPHVANGYANTLHVTERLKEHLQPGNCKGNGFKCACRPLRLIVNGLSPEHLRLRATLGARSLNVILEIIVAFMVLLAANQFTRETTERLVTTQNSADPGFVLLVGISASLVAATLITAFEAIRSLCALGTSYLFSYDSIGSHPENQGQPWFSRHRILSRVFPARRRDYRVGELRRAIPSVLEKLRQLEACQQPVAVTSRTSPAPQNDLIAAAALGVGLGLVTGWAISRTSRRVLRLT